MEIRELIAGEKDEAVALAWLVFMQYVAPDYEEEGIHTFQNFIQNKEAALELVIYGAFEEEELVGILAIRNENHISLFFVKNEFQGKKVGRSLFEYLLAVNQNDVFTVHSSPYAVGIYEKLGFTPVSAQEKKDGILYTPMVYIRNNEDKASS